MIFLEEMTIGQLGARRFNRSGIKGHVLGILQTSDLCYVTTDKEKQALKIVDRN
jgi:hypothetical protein